jgi:hypothetical protein
MERMELERAQARILAEEALRATEEPTNGSVPPGSLPGDTRRLRGLPLMTRGVRGVMPDTQPGVGKSLDRLEKWRETRSWGRLTLAESNGHPPAA